MLVEFTTIGGQLRQDVEEMNKLFGGDGILLSLKLEIPESSANSLRRDARKYVPCSVIESNRVYTNVAIHLKGSAGSFRGFDDKPGFTLNFSYFQPGQKFHGVKKIHLNNSAQDPTFLSEYICGYLFRSAGVPATRVAHAYVQVNNKKPELYVIKESFEKEFFRQYFGDDDGNAYGESGGADIDTQMHKMEGEGVKDWSDLKQLLAATRENNITNCYEKLKNVLEIERFISFMALEVMLCHWDGYTFARHNYRLYNDPSTGKFTFIPHDLDQMMHDPNVPVVPGVNGIVAQTVFRIPELKKRYIERFEEIFDNYFKPDDLTNRIDNMVTRLKPKIEEFDKNFAREFENRSRDLKNRIVNRANSIKRQLAAINPQPTKTQEALRKPENWRSIAEDSASAIFETQKKNDGGHILYIKAKSKTAASWRNVVNLPPGKYIFEIHAKCSNLEAYEDIRGDGAGIRISASQVKRQNKLSGSSDWQKLEYSFENQSQTNVEFVCEMRANSGEVWFDLSSLKVIKK
ncbi:MAG: CotH kinase family protein [Verrucomicrobiae bacterium]|nr:CotH kinase family protein [Verrucomicrobiae bacterium]